MAGQHSDLGPSGFKAAMLCLGKRLAERGLPDEVSVFAAEGTAFHEVAADCLEHGLEPEDFLGAELEADGYEFIFDVIMAKHMRNGLARVRELASGGKMYVETRVDLSPWLGPGQFGTTDVGIVHFGRREIIAWDWKYGEWLPVHPKQNAQAMLYGVGFWNTILRHMVGIGRDWTFRVIIEQPRNSDGGGEWFTTVGELLDWAENTAKPIAERTLDPAAPRTPGEAQCQFCKARRTCGARAAWMLESMQNTFQDLDARAIELRPYSDLTPEQRTYIVTMKGQIEKWLEDLHTQVLADAMAGRPTPGRKAVIGNRGHRFWTDTKKAEALLVAALGEQKAYSRKIVSPAQAEELLGPPTWSKALALIDQPPGKPILVHEDDVRSALKPVADLFDNLDDDTEALI